MRYFFLELFCSSPSLPLAVLIKFQVRSTRFFAEVCGLDLFIGQQFSTRAGKGQGTGLQNIGVIGHLQGHVGVLFVQQHGDAAGSRCG